MTFQDKKARPCSEPDPSTEDGPDPDLPLQLQADTGRAGTPPHRRIPMADLVDRLVHAEATDLNRTMRGIRSDLNASLADLDSDDMGVLRNIIGNAPSELTKAHILNIFNIYDHVIRGRADLVTLSDRDFLIGVMGDSDLKIAGRGADCLQSVFDSNPDLLDSPSIGEAIRGRIDTTPGSRKSPFISLLASVISKAPDFSSPEMAASICGAFMDPSLGPHVRKQACRALTKASSIDGRRITPEILREAVLLFPEVPETAELVSTYPDRIDEQLIVEVFDKFSAGPHFHSSSRLASHILKHRPDLITAQSIDRLEQAFAGLDNIINAFWGLPSLSELLEDTPALRHRVIERMVARLSSRDHETPAGCPEPGLRVICSFPEGARELFRRAEGAIDVRHIHAVVLSSFLEANFFRIANLFSERILSIHPSLARRSMESEGGPLTLFRVREFLDRAGLTVSEEEISSLLDTTLFDIQDERVVVPYDLAGTAYRGGFEVETSSIYATFSMTLALKNVIEGGEIVRKHQKSGRKGLWEISVPACSDSDILITKDPMGTLSFMFAKAPEQKIRTRFIPCEGEPFLSPLRTLIRCQRSEMKAVSGFFEAMHELSRAESPNTADSCITAMENFHAFLISEENGWTPAHKTEMFGEFENAVSNGRRLILGENMTAAHETICSQVHGLIREYSYRCRMAEKMDISGLETIARNLPENTPVPEPCPIAEPAEELVRWLTEKR